MAKKHTFLQFGNREKILLLRVAIIYLLIVAVGDMLGSGNVTYAMKWAKCGSRPIVMQQSGGIWGVYHAASIYLHPDFDVPKYPSPFLTPFDRLYVACTLDEAKYEIRHSGYEAKIIE